MSSLRRLSASPEANLLLFSFLVNFVWEMWQVPFYQGLSAMDHMSAVRICTQASIGDGVISLLAFWSAAAVVRSRRWYLSLTTISALIYWTVGIVITVVMEWLATGPLDRWQYAISMPRLPVVGTGMLPLLQWVLLPAVILFFVRRQVRGAEVSLD
ncbi:MAG: hypothetical protein RJQ07_05205 [Pseudomonadales bacterium]